MRHLLILLCLLPALAFAQEETIEDTTDWRSYHPLEIGNAWERKIECNCLNGNSFLEYKRREVIGDTLIGERRYFLYRTEKYNEDVELTSSQIEYVRYDTTRPAIVALVETDSTRRERVWPSPEACDLSADFNSTITCNVRGRERKVLVEGEYGHGEFLDNLKINAIKSFRFRIPAIMFRSGPGNWEMYGADYPLGYSDELIYVKRGEHEYGKSAVATDTEKLSRKQKDIAILSTYPNPFASAATVKYQIPVAQEVRISVYDVWGRVVREERGVQPSGEHQYHIDGKNLPAGVYIVRVSIPSGKQAAAQVLHVE